MISSLSFYKMFVFQYPPFYRYRIWKAGFSEHCVKITDKLEISYLNKKGSSTEAQVLLFIHGFSSDKAVFCEVVRCLPSKYHVISIDLPGHGKSKPNDTQSDYRLSVMADYVHEVNDFSQHQ